jgi:hypothetical protein
MKVLFVTCEAMPGGNDLTTNFNNRVNFNRRGRYRDKYKSVLVNLNK